MIDEVTIQSIRPEGKGRYQVSFSNGLTCLLYRGEKNRLGFTEEGLRVSGGTYQAMLEELTKRCKKRCLHLLEQKDYTKEQLRRKLLLNQYPDSCVEEALFYAESFHYIDDDRYARTYIRYHQDKASRGQLEQKLLQRGLGRDTIRMALEEEYQADEMSQIRALLAKKQYDPEQADLKERNRVYAFLMRRGFSSSQISKAMKL